MLTSLKLLISTMLLLRTSGAAVLHLMRVRGRSLLLLRHDPRRLVKCPAEPQRLSVRSSAVPGDNTKRKRPSATSQAMFSLSKQRWKKHLEWRMKP
ncbi:unnamed protein product [Pleuronectes platessa]|uniref:Secreted protein n=1 Tax=Pleuronectes platessa TaxID=8262 RepID=A0A9N7TU17_PLEPL|nr:unnamed protein product [Pleuronectes platessa]